jgi:hypothetical protein
MRMAPFALLLPLAACAVPEAGPVAAAIARPAPQIMVPDHPPPQECVPYARQVSGIQLYGDAWTWWDGAAAGRYQRGETPQPGAVLVLRKTPSLFHGHVAVVTNLIGPREILVTHANWGQWLGDHRRYIQWYAGGRRIAAQRLDGGALLERAGRRVRPHLPGLRVRLFTWRCRLMLALRD